MANKLLTPIVNIKRESIVTDNTTSIKPFVDNKKIEDYKKPSYERITANDSKISTSAIKELELYDISKGRVSEHAVYKDGDLSFVYKHGKWNIVQAITPHNPAKQVEELDEDLQKEITEKYLRKKI